MSDRWQFLTGGGLAEILLKGHTKIAHVDEQVCSEPTCASVRLLAEHPEDWWEVDVEAWLATGASQETPKEQDHG